MAALASLLNVASDLQEQLLFLRHPARGRQALALRQDLTVAEALDWHQTAGYAPGPSEGRKRTRVRARSGRWRPGLSGSYRTASSLPGVRESHAAPGLPRLSEDLCRTRAAAGRPWLQRARRGRPSR